MPELEGDLRKHPVQHMLDRRLAVTICTDNRTVSKTTMLKELRLAVDVFELTPYQLKDIVICGFKHSFMHRPYTEKRKYNHKIISYYDKLAREHGVFYDPDKYYERNTLGSSAARVFSQVGNA